MEQIKSYGIITKPELIEFPTEPSELPMKSNVEEIIKISGRRCIDESLKRQYDDTMKELDDICRQSTGLTSDEVVEILLKDTLDSLTNISADKVELKE